LCSRRLLGAFAIAFRCESNQSVQYSTIDESRLSIIRNNHVDDGVKSIRVYSKCYKSDVSGCDTTAFDGPKRSMRYRGDYRGKGFEYSSFERQSSLRLIYQETTISFEYALLNG